MAGDARGYEVVFCWEGTPLSTDLFRLGEEVWVGDRPGARFTLPSETLEAPFALLAPDGSGGSRIGAPHGAGVETEGDATVVTLGAFTFVVRATDLPARVAPASRPDWRAWRYVGLSALLHGILIGLFQLLPPNAMALSRDVDADSARYIRYRLDAVARERDEDTHWLEQGPPSSAEAAPSRDAAKTPPSAPAERLRRGDGAPPSRRGGGEGTPVVGAQAVSQLGTLRALASLVAGMDRGFGPYSGPGLGRDEAGMGPMPSLFGGLDMGSPGGRCVGAACLTDARKVGALATHGYPTGDGTATSGTGLGPRRGAPTGGPTIRPGPTQTTGGLTASQVRRVVHRNLAQVRFCYERALPARPDLEGRVAVKFIVSPSGAVQTALVAQSDLGAGSVESCVTAAVRRWTFPPSDGLTVVTYPFLLQTN